MSGNRPSVADLRARRDESGEMLKLIAGQTLVCGLTGADGPPDEED